MPFAFRWIRTAAICVAVLLVAACASGARPGAMTVGVGPDSLIAEASPARAAVAIGAVSGGSETNPLWKSKVSDGDFRQALQQSLELHAMLASADPRYVLDAELQSLDSPFAGFDLTVTAAVHYTLRSAAETSIKLDEVVKTPYTANFSDAFVAVERLRLANEGAMRENIKAIIARIITTLKADNGRPAGAFAGTTALAH